MSIDSTKPGRWLPKHHYPLVELRCVLPSCDETREIGLAFNLPDGSVVRYRLSPEHAAGLLGALAEDRAYREKSGCQSPRSSDSSSVDGSVLPGQSV